jgi:hypothetical protein
MNRASDGADKFLFIQLVLFAVGIVLFFLFYTYFHMTVS